MQSVPQVPRAQWAALGALAAVGVLLVASAGATPAAARSGAPWLHALEHALALAAAGCLVWAVPGRRGADPRIGWAAAGGVALALLATLVPGLGVEAGGARRGVGVEGVFTLQPSVLLAALTPALCARGLERGRGAWLALLLVAACAVCAAQPNFAHLGLLLAVAAASAAGAGRWRAAGGALACGATACLAALCYPYVRWRIASFVDAELTADTRGLAGALGEVGVLGVGLGQGSWKRLLSTAPSDYVFAVGLEELGVLGALGITTLLACAVISLGLRRPAGPARARAWGTAAFLAVPAAVHVAVALRLLPVTGVHFPFLSADPSATLAVGLAVGLSAERGAAVRRVALRRENRLGFSFRGLKASLSWSRALSLELRREAR